MVEGWKEGRGRGNASPSNPLRHPERGMKRPHVHLGARHDGKSKGARGRQQAAGGKRKKKNGDGV
jgi:hypothetical protein